MASFRILDARSAEDRAAWVGAWSVWPGREVSAHPTYVEFFARPADRVLAAASDGVLFPFIVRSLSKEAWADPEEPACDLTSPYGYGGAFAWGGASAAEAFWDELDRWAAREHVVTAFARLSLFPDQLLDFRGDVVEVFPNVVRELSGSEDELWKDYAHKVRKNVKRALELGLSVERDANGRRLGEFLGIYEQTMDRRSAGPAYYFGRPFFERLIAQLPQCIQFFHVLSDGRVVSTELCFVSAEHVYSFLGGTLAEAFVLRANDLLKHEIIRWAKEAGKKTFVLGGGYGAADGIFRYKLSFAPQGERPFRVGTTRFRSCRMRSLDGSTLGLGARAGARLGSRRKLLSAVSSVSMARIDLSPPHVGPAGRELLLDAFDSNWIAPLRPHVDAFEREFADTVGAPHAIALSSGTAALHLSLLLLGVATLVSSLTFAATANAVRYVRGRDEEVT